MIQRLSVLVLLGPALAFAPLRAQPPDDTNLLRNARFSQGVAQWRVVSEPQRSLGALVAFDTLGGDLFAALTRSHDASGGAATGWTQCVPVVAGALYTVEASILVPESQSASGAAQVSLGFTSTPDCNGGFVGGALPITTDDQSGQWVRFEEVEVVAPPGAVAVAVSLGVFKEAGPGARTALFDDLYFGRTDERVFPCAEGTAVLACIGGRFAVTVLYTVDGTPAQARAVALDPLALESGAMFWFFSADNPELLIKVLPGCGINQHFWIFYSAGTNVGLDVRVHDRVTGVEWRSSNPEGTPAPPVQDVEALPCFL